MCKSLGQLYHILRPLFLLCPTVIFPPYPGLLGGARSKRRSLSLSQTSETTDRVPS